jgi:gamma-glutamyltranspeptidase/glutathione hydrolase
MRLCTAALAFVLIASPALAADPAPVAGSKGMVVTAQHLASDVGAEVLREGGNAVDAAVAVGYALAVVYPQAGNIGGGGFMTIRLADGRTTFLDYREKAPLAATATMFQDASGKVVPGRSTDSWLAVGVPGTVLGLETARIKYGTLSRGTGLCSNKAMRPSWRWRRPASPRIRPRPKSSSLTGVP